MKSNLALFQKRNLISAAIFVGILVVLAIRSRNAVVYPVVGHEDGRDLLAFYFNNGSSSGIIRFYQGYISVVPNIIAWASTRLPLPAAPYIFTFLSLTIAALGFYLLSRKSHEWLIPETSIRYIIVFVIVLLPLGKGYMVNNLMYSQWSLLFLLFVLLTQIPLPSSVVGLSVYTIVVTLCAVSHPLSLLALPLCAIQFAHNENRHQRLCIVFCTCAILIYQVLGVKHTAGITFSLDSVIWALKVFLSRVSFESLFGAHATNLLVTNGGTRYVNVIGAMILCLAAFMVLTGSRYKRDICIAAGMLSLAFAIVFISTSFRYTGFEAKFEHLKNPYLQRYIYIPKLLLILMILRQLIPWIRSDLAPRRLFKKAAILAACSLYLLGITADNGFLYRESRTEGYRVRAFLSSAYADLRRAKKGEPYRSRHILKRDGAWDIILMLDKRMDREVSKVVETKNEMFAGQRLDSRRKRR